MSGDDGMDKIVELAKERERLREERAKKRAEKDQAKRAREERAEAEPWRKKLIVTPATQEPRAILANAVIALREAPEWRGQLHFDAFAERTVLRGKAPWLESAAEHPWTAVDDLRVTEWLQTQCGILVTPNVAAEAVEAVAHERQFHPVRDFLGKCSWDGTERLDTWLTTYVGAADTAYTRAVGAKWLISGVARVMRPGCKVDHVLILESEQGRLKSTALRILGDPWFTDEIADIGSKDAAMQLAGRWIIEIAELAALGRPEIEKMKAFLSRTADRFRPPYGRRVGEFKRQCILAGTTNQTEYLRDETGNRRFWPIRCGTIDIDALTRDRDQLWAEALARFQRGDAWWLDDTKLVKAAAEAQEDRYQRDAWEETIAEFLSIREDTSVEDIMKDALFINTERRTQADANRVARCLRLLKWERYQDWNGGKRRWRYRPSPASPDRED
jgi:predicted P-loop ATPase